MIINKIFLKLYVYYHIQHPVITKWKDGRKSENAICAQEVNESTATLSASNLNLPTEALLLLPREKHMQPDTFTG